MNGMLQHQEHYSEEIQRRHQEAHRWAQADALGRFAQSARESAREHPRQARLIAVVSPMAIGFTILAVLI